MRADHAHHGRNHDPALGMRGEDPGRQHMGHDKGDGTDQQQRLAPHAINERHRYNRHYQVGDANNH